MKPTIAIVTILCCFVGVALTTPSDDDPIVTEEMVDYINSVQSLWVASTDQGAIALKTRAEARALAGVTNRTPYEFPRRSYKGSVFQNIPTNYDPRVKYPYCPTIQQIRDQSSSACSRIHCGSCWAFGAVEAMSDRYCILLNQNITLSAGNLMSCCANCSDGDGCDGGLPAQAWAYWLNTGIVTEECQPYPIPPCTPGTNGTIENCPPPAFAPDCNTSCVNGLMYSKSLHKGRSAYTLQGEQDMIVELLKYGPIEVVMNVYEDFYSYKSGIYSPTTNVNMGLHAVKIIGYGVEQGQKYWLVANSWNVYWGMNGFFKILRGVDECGIEDSVYAGLPLF